MALFDILRGSENQVKFELSTHNLNRIDNKYYALIVQDNEFFIDEIHENYHLVDSLCIQTIQCSLRLRGLI